MSSKRRRRLLLGFALAAAAAFTGCGLGAGATPGGVQLLITREFGARTLHSLRTPAVHGQETVMSLLLRNANVGTRYGGGFVQSIDGRHGGHEGGEPVDWFYYVNGVEASKGAADVDLHRGDRVWWDLHDWNQTDYIPAVVGSYPEPFRDGLDGRRLPVRVECAEPEGDACRTVAGRLREAGVPSARAELGPAGVGPESLRLVVGTWSQVRRELGVQSLQGGPAASGVYARVAAHGSLIELLDGQGRSVRTLGGSAGLLAATRYSGEEPEWVVTGTDSAGVDLAAHALDEADLHGRFAVAVTAGSSANAAAGSFATAAAESSAATTGPSSAGTGTVLALPRPDP